MRSTFSWLIVLTVIVSGPNGFSAEESHQEKKETSTARPTATEKKPSTLAEKLSACLTERPSGDKKEDKAEVEEKLGKTYPKKDSVDTAQTGPSGAEIFQANCASCHAPNASQGPIVDWALAAQRAGTDMPPNGKKFSADELSKLRAFFASKK